MTVKSSTDALAAKERPYVIPEHDPEGSIATSRYSQDMASVLSQTMAPSSSQQSLVEMTAVAKPKKAARSNRHSLTPHMPTLDTKLRFGHLPPNSSPPPVRPPRPIAMRLSSGMRSSRFSITPSMLLADYAMMHPGHGRSVPMHTIVSKGPKPISPMHIVKLPEEPTSNEPPDGGTLAWMQVLAGFFIVMDAQQVLQWGLNQSYGVFQAYYESVLLPSHSPSSIAWIGSFQIFLLFFMAIITSGQIDKGRFRHCFTGGSVLLFASILATSWCKEYWHFMLTQGIATGMGMGLAFGSGAQVLMTYFRKNLGIATGIASAGGAVGGMIFPAICEKLIFKVGFGWTVRGTSNTIASSHQTPATRHG
ncbi:MAG: hypothetical protein LQ352_008335 [Teloschistes flavicans]|nr:MAG: hypothetical protein LQ352_008335 [Teloschistes flavicans]